MTPISTTWHLQLLTPSMPPFSLYRNPYRAKSQVCLPTSYKPGMVSSLIVAFEDQNSTKAKGTASRVLFVLIWEQSNCQEVEAVLQKYQSKLWHICCWYVDIQYALFSIKIQSYLLLSSPLEFSITQGPFRYCIPLYVAKHTQGSDAVDEEDIKVILQTMPTKPISTTVKLLSQFYDPLATSNPDFPFKLPNPPFLSNILTSQRLKTA